MASWASRSRSSRWATTSPAPTPTDPGARMMRRHARAEQRPAEGRHRPRRPARSPWSPDRGQLRAQLWRPGGGRSPPGPDPARRHGTPTLTRRRWRCRTPADAGPGARAGGRAGQRLVAALGRARDPVGRAGAGQRVAAGLDLPGPLGPGRGQPAADLSSGSARARGSWSTRSATGPKRQRHGRGGPATADPTPTCPIVQDDTADGAGR